MAVRRGGDHAHGEDDDADVHDHPAVGPPDEAPPPPDMAGLRGAHGQVEGPGGGGAGHGTESETDQRGRAAQPERHADHDRADADPDRDGETLPEHRPADLAPAQHRRHGHEEQERQAGRNSDRVEEGRADGDLLLRDRLVQKRIHGAEQHHERETDEQHVVEQERTLASEGRVDPPR